MTFGLAFLALAFVLLAFFTQNLLPTKGSLGGIKDFHNLAREASLHPVSVAMIPVCGLLALGLIATAMKSGASPVLQYFQSRVGASVLLLSVAACQMPLYFCKGDMDAEDFLANVNALVEAAANYRSGHLPFYTFHFANGATLGLQYPMLRTLWGGIFTAVSPFSANTDFQILCALTHLFLIGGIYRLLRAGRFSRLASVIPAVTLAGCHEMLLYYLSSSFATFASSAFATWCFQALVRWFSSLRLRNALAAGFWFGLAILSHPVTGLFSFYFLLPPLLYFTATCSPRDRHRVIGHAFGSGLLAAIIALPYVASVIFFSRYNTYHAGAVTSFQDGPVRIFQNFRWITKYFGGNSSGVESGEYISVILVVLALAGVWIILSRARVLNPSDRSARNFVILTFWFFCAGAILFYGRDLLTMIPGVKLLKVNNRSFIFLALGIAMFSAISVDYLLHTGRARWIACLGLLLFLEQSPYWLRPTYFSLPESQKLNAGDFASSNPRTASFLVIYPANGGGCGTREDVAFRRAGFCGISPIDEEEAPATGHETRILHDRLALVETVAEAQPMINRLKWMRVTDVVWRSDAIPPIDLSQLGATRPVTHGMAVHLNSPLMDRELRAVRLSVVPADIQGSRTVLPIGFSPFLHCHLSDSPQQEIPLSSQEGYCAIERPVPAGTQLTFTASSPLWLRLLTYVSLVASTIGGFLLLNRNFVHKTSSAEGELTGMSACI